MQLRFRQFRISSSQYVFIYLFNFLFNSTISYLPLESTYSINFNWLCSILRPVGYTCGIWNINIKCKSYIVITQNKLSKERGGIATGWPLLNKIVILMLCVLVWVLCEYYIWTKNHVQWMSQITTINDNNNDNTKIKLQTVCFCFIQSFFANQKKVWNLSPFSWLSAWILKKNIYLIIFN